jgi:cysteine desulfurase family protein
LIYFDAAATTLEKPPQVGEAVARAVCTLASPGRGGHAAARAAEEIAFRCRKEAAELFGAGQPENVIFTANATHGLNIAVRSLVRRGGLVVISGYEHNAVTRQLCALEAAVTVAEVPPFRRDLSVAAFREAITGREDAVICNHVSNVFGCVQPIEEVAEICRERGVPLIVDASQSAGALPVRMDELRAAFIAMPGHKGLYGPQGTGLLLCGAEAEPILYGGTGSDSLRQTMPDWLPDRLEAGTHNMPGIAGLLEGIRFIKRSGPERIIAHERRLLALAADRLKTIPGAAVWRAADEAEQAGVLSFRAEGWDCEELAAALAGRDIAVRAGYHCAPLAHRTAGTLDGGTVRISFSAFNTADQVERFVVRLRRMLREKVTQ